MASKHPWNFGEREYTSWGAEQQIVDADGDSVGWIECEEGDSTDARLATAAPELLAACEAFLREWDGIANLRRMDAAIAQTRAAVAKAAIRKAKGEAP